MGSGPGPPFGLEDKASWMLNFFILGKQELLSQIYYRKKIQLFFSHSGHFLRGA